MTVSAQIYPGNHGVARTTSAKTVGLRTASTSAGSVNSQRDKIGWQKEVPMSDTDTAEPVDTIDDTTEQPDTVEEAAEKTFTAAEIDRIVERRLERERAKYSDYEQLKAEAAELAQLRDATQAEIQAAIERAEAAEKRVAEAEYSALRVKVAATKGVPASSLVGDTEDELIASADELIAWRDANKQSSPPPKRAPSTSAGLKSGASGNENTNSDPKVAAAEALRRLRNDG